MYHITFYPSEDKKKSHIDYSAVLNMFFKVEKKEVDNAVFKIKTCVGSYSIPHSQHTHILDSAVFF